MERRCGGTAIVYATWRTSARVDAIAGPASSGPWQPPSQVEEDCDTVLSDAAASDEIPADLAPGSYVLCVSTVPTMDGCVTFWI